VQQRSAPTFLAHMRPPEMFFAILPQIFRVFHCGFRGWCKLAIIPKIG